MYVNSISNFYNCYYLAFFSEISFYSCNNYNIVYLFVCTLILHTKLVNAYFYSYYHCAFFSERDRTICVRKSNQAIIDKWLKKNKRVQRCGSRLRERTEILFARYSNCKSHEMSKWNVKATSHSRAATSSKDSDKSEDATRASKGGEGGERRVVHR